MFQFDFEARCLVDFSFDILFSYEYEDSGRFNLGVEHIPKEMRNVIVSSSVFF